METQVYQVLKCSAPQMTKSALEGHVPQEYVVAEIVKVNTNPALAQFKNLIIGSKPFNLTFFKDQGVFFDMVQKPEAYIAGNLITRKTKPYFVIDNKTGQPYKYMKDGALKGKSVVATSVKFFLHDGQDEDVEFRKVMSNNAGNLVPTGELAVYADHLGLDKEELKAQGIDVGATQAQQQKDADILAGETTPPVQQPAPPATPPTQPPAGQQPTPPVGQ